MGKMQAGGWAAVLELWGVVRGVVVTMMLADGTKDVGHGGGGGRGRIRRRGRKFVRRCLGGGF